VSGNRELVERFIASLEARDWEAWTGLLHPGVVYDIPQSRERIRGRDRYLRFNQEYPGDTAAELTEHAKRHLAANKYPRDIRIVPAVPLTSVGKLDRKKLRQWIADGNSG
jgi:acyl-CoA synthetase (AMP-forming)/AMP-acid ligase II